MTLARATLTAQGTPTIKVATVVNFPRGEDEPEAVLAETRAALHDGADEIDLVIPWRALMAGDEASARALVRRCKVLCGDRVLKVIIESGELKEPALIRAASLLAIEEGVDFIKTSTGKVAVNATPEASRVMLAASQFGEHWADAAHFRFGASSLLNQLLATLNGCGSQAPAAAAPHGRY